VAGVGVPDDDVVARHLRHQPVLRHRTNLVDRRCRPGRLPR
jgi:hypothetical protein